MNKSDVIIIGAGPAGAVAAHRLAAAGVKTQLLDKEDFPRDKPCGDGVAASGLMVLERSGLKNWIEKFPAPEILKLVSPGGEILQVKPEREDNICYGRTIPRRQLDTKLVETARKAGAEFSGGVKISQVSMQKGKNVQVSNGREKWEAPLIILAEGSNATLARRLGLVQDKPDLIAIRQYFENGNTPSNKLEIHFSADIIPGYNWIFPSSQNRLNIGTGTFVWRTRKKDCDLHKILKDFTEQQQTLGNYKKLTPLGSPVGHPIRTMFNSQSCFSDHILLAGETAGLVNPLTGEGIAASMESGEIAAESVLKSLKQGDFSKAGLANYGAGLQKHFSTDWKAARLLRKITGMPRQLDRLFINLNARPELGKRIAKVILGFYSPKSILTPEFFLKLLF